MKERSDTVSVTEDGRIVVDIAKLWRKPHIVAMVADIRKKTVMAPKPDAASRKDRRGLLQP